MKQKKGTLKKTEINKITERISIEKKSMKPKPGSLRRPIKVIKLLARLTKLKREKKQITNIRVKERTAL